MAIQRRHAYYPTYRYPVAAGVSIAADDVVVIDSTDGYADRAASSGQSEDVACGVAQEAADNTDGSDGDVWVIVEEGEFLMEFPGQLSYTSGAAYVEADNKASWNLSGSRALLGYVSEYVNSSRSWIDIRHALNAINRYVPF